MLEDQLNSSRRRADKVLELESEIIKYKQLLNDMALVCETWECKFHLHSNETFNAGVETLPKITVSNSYISVLTETVMKNRYSE